MHAQLSTLPVRHSLGEGGSSQLDAEILSAWIAERRAILAREGCAVRAGTDNTIEVQLINCPQRTFAPLTLPNGRTHFDTTAERDDVLARLQAPAPQPFVRHASAHLP